MFLILFHFNLLAIAYGAIGPVANMHIINEVISPDGFHRSAVLAGDGIHSASFPGPVITAKKGDYFKLNVINSLTDTSMLRGTSIHWHGIFQHQSSWADGPVGVNQCPITSGDSFLYEFSVPDQAGTFWYHSHYSTQYCDGLRGALVIYDPNDPHKKLYDVDDESTIITLADWYHVPSQALLKAFQTAVIPMADSILINGKGRSPGTKSSPLSVITVKPNTRYRFRLISMSCDPNFIFSIDDHTMTIIEVDGVNVIPVEVDSIQIYAGQRYSFVLNANAHLKANRPQNFWIRAKPSNATDTGFDGGLNSAILRYQGAPNADPAPVDTPISHNPMLETTLHPLEKPGAPGGSGPPDYALNLDMEVVIGSDSKASYAINGASFVPPSVPVLLQIMSGAHAAQDLLPAGNVYTLKPNQVIELTIPGGVPGAPHPFHLHGHTFDVVRSAGSTGTHNYVNPVRRDVVNTGSDIGDNVTIRFRTDNAGPWIFHCHIDWHLALGLAVVFAEDVPKIGSSKPPVSWDKLCPTFDAQPPELTK